jgi:DNA-binding transcriptional MocR family regulator
MEYKLSDYGALSIEQSPIGSMTADFSTAFRKGIDINLGVGYVNDDTIPSNELRECFSYVLQHSHIYKSSLNYGAAQGSNHLIHAIRDYYVTNEIGNVTQKDFDSLHIAIGANGATSILDAIADVLPKGIVFTVEPMYYIYTETLRRKGYTICAIPETDEGIDINYLKKYIETCDIHTISFFYIITVNNPTTQIITNICKKEIVHIAEDISRKRGHIVPVIFDKAYEDIIYDSSVEKPESGLLYQSLPCVFEVGTLSKIIAPALRIGYVISQYSTMFSAIIQRNNDVGFSAPLILQDVSSVFLQKYIKQHREKVMVGYAQKAKTIIDYIHKYLGDFVERVQGGKAGFYVYITFKTIQTHSSSDFFAFLSRSTNDSVIDGEKGNVNPRLLYVPGEMCMNEHSEQQELRYRQLRISFGFEPIEELERAILLMQQAAEYAQKKSR